MRVQKVVVATVWMAAASFGAEPKLDITVQVYNWAHVAPGTLMAAEGEGTRIFREAGVGVLWLNCPLSPSEAKESPICAEPCPWRRFVLRIVYDVPAGFGKTSQGVALNDTGIYASVFYRRVDEFAKEGIATHSQILGHAMAHEIGHLLLDVKGHTERAFERAIDFAGTRISAKLILGPDIRDRLSLWAYPSDTDYPPLRALPWRPTESQAHTHETPFKGFGAGDVPPELLDRASTKHSEIQTLSLIREKLWAEAHWHAVAFMGLPDDSAPPLLVPVFKSATLAKGIIEGLREDIGTDDRDDLLRVSIIRGINKNEPFWYRKILGDLRWTGETCSNRPISQTDDRMLCCATALVNNPNRSCETPVTSER